MKTKRIVILGLGVALALLSFKVMAQKDSVIAGKWYVEEMDKSVIEVARLSDGSYEGIIISSKEKGLVGHKVIYGFNCDAKEKLYTGTINSAARNIELDGTIQLEQSGKLKVTGKKFFMTKTFYWIKTE